jgi:hypothetical protein
MSSNLALDISMSKETGTDYGRRSKPASHAMGFAASLRIAQDAIRHSAKQAVVMLNCCGMKQSF